MHWGNCISIFFHIEWDIIVVTVFLSILNQIDIHLVQNRKEICHHDHIPFNVKGNGKIFLSACLCVVFYWPNVRYCLTPSFFLPAMFYKAAGVPQPTDLRSTDFSFNDVRISNLRWTGFNFSDVRTTDLSSTGFSFNYVRTIDLDQLVSVPMM